MQAKNFAKVSILTGLALLTFTSSVAVSAPRSKAVKVATSGTQSTDESTVRSKISSLKEHAGRRDAKSMASLWTVDGIYIDESGNKASGREAVEKIFSENFDQLGTNQPVPIDINVETVRFPAPGVAFVDGTVKRNNGKEMVPTTRYSMTFVKQKSGDWCISSATEAPIDAPNTGVNPLEKLQWIIGDWSAVRDGQQVNMKADWSARKTFITCTFEVKKGDRAPVTETQVIGWDPHSQAPISWNFDANGGFGSGVWNKRKEQWRVTSSGVQRDGSISSAVNVYAPIGANEFSWQAVNRHIDGAPLADTAVIKVQRVK